MEANSRGLCDTTNILTDNALVAAGNIIIPFIPEKLNQNSLRLLRKQLDGLEKFHDSIQEIALIANRVENISEHGQTLDAVRESFLMPIVEIPKRTDLSRSINQHHSIFRYERENQRVEDARERFGEIADIVEDVFSGDGRDE